MTAHSSQRHRVSVTVVINPVVPPAKGCCQQIHLNLVAMWLTPAIHFDRQSASNLLIPTSMPSSSTHLLRIFFYLPLTSSSTPMPFSRHDRPPCSTRDRTPIHTDCHSRTTYRLIETRHPHQLICSAQSYSTDISVLKVIVSLHLSQRTSLPPTTTGPAQPNNPLQCPSSSRWLRHQIASLPLTPTNIRSVTEEPWHNFLMTRHSFLVVWHSFFVTRHGFLMVWHSFLVTQHSFLVTWHSFFMVWYSFLVTWQLSSDTTPCPYDTTQLPRGMT